jgi:hypothetical protein
MSDGDFYQGWDTEIAQKIKSVETYWHDHSLESFEEHFLMWYH